MNREKAIKYIAHAMERRDNDARCIAQEKLEGIAKVVTVHVDYLKQAEGALENHIYQQAYNAIYAKIFPPTATQPE